MKRRSFFGTAGGAAAAGGIQPHFSHAAVAGSRPAVRDGRLAGMTLPELRERYRSYLFDEFLPFMDKYVIDTEYGGFMCSADRDGTRLNTDNNAWSLGRGIWTYSYLYTHITKEPHHLDVARRAVEFTLKLKPTGDVLFPRMITREGKPKEGPDTQVYSDMFIALGLAEFSGASGEMKYWDVAKEIMLKCIRIYDRPDYYPNVGASYLGAEAPPLPGARIGGVWMTIVNCATSMLELKSDLEVEKVAARCVDAVMNHHFNPEFGLNNELINHDLSRPAHPFDQLSFTSHTWETLWMIMVEAMRLKDRNLFNLASERIRRHVECSWDDVYGGAFSGCRNVNENIWILEKAMWPHEEILIGTMMTIEHTGAEWAQELFSKTFAYVNEKFYLKKYGFPMWIRAGDRKVTYTPHYTNVDLFHNPRHLMMNILALDRIIKRGGVVSGFWKA
jgi:mannose/cellobiose epimerase-like protein (N-acyl-D-glucosamine 2-epimerase family)